MKRSRRHNSIGKCRFPKGATLKFKRDQLRERRGRKGPVPKTGHYDFQNRPNGLETGQCRKTYEQKIVERFGGQQELDLVIPAPVPQTPEVLQQPSLFGGDEQLLRLAESLAWRDEDDKAAD